MRGLILMLPLALLAGCNRGRGNHDEAKALIAERCATCHVVPGVREAVGRVGPSLKGIGTQQIIAGRFPNNPATLERWLRDPQSMMPGTVMPATGLTPAQAHAIAGYLFALDTP